MFENGEWHVPDYCGIEATVGVVDSVGFTITRSASGIQDKEALATLRNDGARLAPATNEADPRSMLQLTPRGLLDAGAVARNPGDTAKLPEPSGIVMDEIIREAPT